MRSPALDTRLYHAVLYLYPPAFREEFGAEMIRDFREAREEAHTEGAKSMVGFWTRTSADTLATIPSQWVRTGLPIIGLVSALGPLLAAACTAWLWPWDRMRIAADHPHRDVIALQIMVMTVLFVVVATVLMAQWFTRQMMSRGRGRPRTGGR